MRSQTVPQLLPQPKAMPQRCGICASFLLLLLCGGLNTLERVGYEDHFESTELA